MPIPLANNIADLLRTDSIAAMGALMVIAGAHREILEWMARTMTEPSSQSSEHAPRPRSRPRPAPKRAKSNGAHKPRKDDARLSKRYQADRARGRRAKVLRLLLANDLHQRVASPSRRRSREIRRGQVEIDRRAGAAQAASQVDRPVERRSRTTRPRARLARLMHNGRLSRPAAMA
jgi:hypothetical protein